jgi:CRP-like cAMP-binding protein
VYQPINAQNRILQQLPAAALARLRPQLSRVRLRRRAVLQEANETAETVTFIEHGLVAVIARTQADGLVGVGVVGQSGLVGVPALLGTRRAPYRCVVEVEGEALQIAAVHIRAAMNEAAVRQPLMNYVQSLLVQNVQAALCSSRHDLVQRLARWLLLAHDRLDHGVIPLTHALLSVMLGVRRASVTGGLSYLEDIGAIAKGRGAITVLDRNLLERHACECYRIIAGENARHLVAVPQVGETNRVQHRADLVPAIETFDYSGA